MPPPDHKTDQEYTVEYWDGENWVECDRVQNSVKEADNIIFNNDPDHDPTQHAYMGSSFGPVTASRFRINMTGGEVSIWEISLYGNTEAVDLTALKQAVLDAGSIELDGYTEDSAKALQEALAEAEKVLADSGATQEDADRAAETLNQAIADLVLKSDEEQAVSKKTLEYFLNRAKEYQANGAVDSCVESVKKLFEEAVAEGEAVMADEHATRDEVMDASLKLMKAIHALDMKAADKTDLEMAVALGEMIDLSRYVEAGQQEFTDALTAAKETLADGDALQGDVDTAWNTLVSAMENLRLKADKDVLEALLDEAAGLDLSRYTEESAAVFRAALASAQAVFADGTLTEADQQKVDDAVNVLKEAKAGLTALNGGSGDGSGTGSGDEQEPGGSQDTGGQNSGSQNTENQNSADQSGSKTGNGGNADKNSGGSVDKAAKTGDAAPVAGWILFAAVSGAAAFSVITGKRRRGQRG